MEDGTLQVYELAVRCFVYPLQCYNSNDIHSLHRLRMKTLDKI